MRLLPLLALALLPLTLASAFAEEENAAVDFRCVTSTPTTSFIAKTTGDEVRLTVIHHNGVKYMPIHQGIVVPADFPLLQKKAEVMQKLGDRIELVFEKKHCKKYGDKLFGCGLGKVIANGETSAERASLLTKTATERLYDIEFQKSQVSAGFSVDGSYYSIDNDFYYEDCQFTSSKTK